MNDIKKYYLFEMNMVPVYIVFMLIIAWIIGKTNGWI